MEIKIFNPFVQSKQKALVFRAFGLKANPNNTFEKKEDSLYKKPIMTAQQEIKQRKDDAKVLSQKVSDEVKEAEKGMVTIFFRDPITNKLTRSALSSDSINRLGKEFGQNDLSRRYDGSYILSGKAESFVSSWYADIAYTRGYIKSDKNQDGFLDNQELVNVRSGFMGLNSSKGLFVESYIPIGGSIDSLGNKFIKERPSDAKDGFYAGSTIGLELDKMVQKDGDFDGNLTYAESGADEAFGEQNLDDFQALSIAVESLSKNATDSTLKVKDILDKLGKGFEYEELSEEEKDLLIQVGTKIFDIVKNQDTGQDEYIYNPQKFQNFYPQFQQEFKERVAKYIGLELEEADKFDYDNIGKVAQELEKTFSDSNSISYNDMGDIVRIWA